LIPVLQGNHVFQDLLVLQGILFVPGVPVVLLRRVCRQIRCFLVVLGVLVSLVLLVIQGRLAVQVVQQVLVILLRRVLLQLL